MNDFPLQRFLTRALVLERPTLLVVGEGPISQDIAAVLIKCQQNFAVLRGNLGGCRWLLVVGRGQKPGWQCSWLGFANDWRPELISSCPT